MQAKAIAKYQRISPLKVNFICREIRGKHVDEALSILRFTPKAGARLLEKVLKSAVANAENNHNLDRKDLYVLEAYANDCLLYTSTQLLVLCFLFLQQFLL